MELERSTEMITLNKEDAFTIVDIISKAQEVIRCKDCKYWQKSKIKGDRNYHTCMCVRLGKEGIIAFANDFCSRGERKGD